MASNSAQTFSFDNNVKKLSFSYQHSVKNEDVSITLITSSYYEKYLINIYLNNKYLNHYTIDSSHRLILFSIIMKNNCPNFKTICNIFMTLELVNPRQNITVEIGINYHKNYLINETFVSPDK